MIVHAHTLCLFLAADIGAPLVPSLHGSIVQPGNMFAKKVIHRSNVCWNLDSINYRKGIKRSVHLHIQILRLELSI